MVFGLKVGKSRSRIPFDETMAWVTLSRMQASTILETNAPRATVLVRLLVRWVFLSEGIQKFLFPDTLGVGRFIKIGIPRRNSLRHSDHENPHAHEVGILGHGARGRD